MTLEPRLARELIARHPTRAAAVFDHLEATDGAPVLADVSTTAAASLVASMSPHRAAEVLAQLDAATAAEILEALEQDVASRLARRLDQDRRDEVLAALPARARNTLETLLRFPEHTAGALMDAEVLALAEDLTCAEAMKRVREVPDLARYNLYIVDRDQRLVGVINLRELLLAPPGKRLAEIMVRNPVSLNANADRSVVVSHPGWKRVHSIPVVDDQGAYLGAVRYRTLRQLEEELLGVATTDANASEALGEVFAAGASGLIDALTTPSAKRRMEGA